MPVKISLCPAKCENMLLLLLHCSLLLLVEGGRVTLGRDGGYRGIVVNIGEEIPEEECAVLVENIKVTPEVNFITIAISPWWPHHHEKSSMGMLSQRQHYGDDHRHQRCHNTTVGGKYGVFPTSAAPTYDNMHR